MFQQPRRNGPEGGLMQIHKIFGEAKQNNCIFKGGRRVFFFLDRADAVAIAEAATDAERRAFSRLPPDAQVVMHHGFPPTYAAKRYEAWGWGVQVRAWDPTANGGRGAVKLRRV